MPRPDLKKWFHVYVLKPASLFINQTVYLSTYLSIGLPIYLDIYRSIYSSIYLSTYPAHMHVQNRGPGFRIPAGTYSIPSVKLNLATLSPLGIRSPMKRSTVTLNLEH